MSEFWAMGGYGVWVWSAWGLSVVVLVWMAVSSARRLAQARERARRARGEGG